MIYSVMPTITLSSHQRTIYSYHKYSLIHPNSHPQSILCPTYCKIISHPHRRSFSSLRWRARWRI